MFRTGNKIRNEEKGALFVLATLCVFVFSLPAYSELQDPKELEKLAKKKLAEKLKKVSGSYAVQEARYEGGKEDDFDRNNGNPGRSNSAYHSYTWDYCLKTYGGGHCEEWLGAYGTLHGLQKASEGNSSAETVFGEKWSGSRKLGTDGSGKVYQVWEVETLGGGSFLDPDGRLDRSRLKKYQLTKDVTQAMEKVGYDTAAKSMSLTFDDDAPKETMGNLEAQRLMAGRWTRMMRNRLVSNLGELRANDKGIEFALGEDVADCDQYLQALRQVPDEIERERIKFQARLDPETFSNQIQRRYEMCIQARNASVYKINPKVDAATGKIMEGDKNTEQIDKWQTRLNIAAIDYGGIDLESQPKPDDVPLTENQLKSEIAQWNEGGTEMRSIRITNREQLESYNQQLEIAAQGIEEVAARSPFIANANKQIRDNKVNPNNVGNLAKFNGITKEMENYLKDTQVPGVQSIESSNPRVDENPEDAPSQLTVTAAR